MFLDVSFEMAPEIYQALAVLNRCKLFHGTSWANTVSLDCFESWQPVGQREALEASNG